MQINKDTIIVDGNIRARNVLVIDDQGTNLGVMPLFKALQEARERGLNLIQMSPGATPTTKIMDYGKYKYEESKRTKEQLKKQRAAQVSQKEIIFHPTTAENDLRIKAKKACEFINDNAIVKITIKCVGRESSHPNVFKQTLDTFMKYIPNAIAVPCSSERNKYFYMLSKMEDKEV